MEWKKRGDDDEHKPAEVSQSQDLEVHESLSRGAEVEALIFGNPQSLTDESDQQHDRTSSTDPGMNERRLVDTESRNTSTKLAHQDEVATSIDGRDADDPIPRPLRTSERPAKDVSHLDERKKWRKEDSKNANASSKSAGGASERSQKGNGEVRGTQRRRVWLHGQESSRRRIEIKKTKM
ncbi:hypothetical protein L1887_59121 [Cichorium endivia]|nr:hypothetical protein L1887_59121 [Cichorium endivia]